MKNEDFPKVYKGVCVFKNDARRSPIKYVIMDVTKYKPQKKIGPLGLEIRLENRRPHYRLSVRMISMLEPEEASYGCITFKNDARRSLIEYVIIDVTKYTTGKYELVRTRNKSRKPETTLPIVCSLYFNA